MPEVFFYAENWTAAFRSKEPYKEQPKPVTTPR